MIYRSLAQFRPHSNKRPPPFFLNFIFGPKTGPKIRPPPIFITHRESAHVRRKVYHFAALYDLLTSKRSLNPFLLTYLIQFVALAIFALSSLMWYLSRFHAVSVHLKECYACLPTYFNKILSIWSIWCIVVVYLPILACRSVFIGNKR